MASIEDIQAVRTAVQNYIAASSNGDVKLAKCVFHSDARMSGYLDDEFITGTPELFFQSLENETPSGEAGGYSAEITSIEVAGKVAAVTLKETGFIGRNFTDLFHLAKIDGEWKIISKTFSSE